MPSELRPEQRKWLEEMLAASESHGRVCGQAITAFGKTFTTAVMVQGAVEVGHRVMITVPRHELIDQTSLAYQEMGIRHGIVSSGYSEDYDAPVQIVTPKSALSRVKKYGENLLNVSFAIDDECHNAGSPTYEDLYKALPKIEYRFGVSGTPIRTTGAGLKEAYDVMVCSPQPEEMLALGERIVEPKVFSPPMVSRDELAKLKKFAGDYSLKSQEAVLNTDRFNGDIVRYYEEIAPGTRAIAFTATVKQSQDVCKRFVSNGHKAEVLFAGMPKSDRRDMVKAYRNSEFDVLLNCEIVSEGFNVEGVETVIFDRKTDSLRIWLQGVGRSIRWQFGKTCSYIIDAVGNIYRNGHPMASRHWDLYSGTSGAAYKSPIKQCLGCFKWVKLTAKGCECGKEFGGKEQVFKTRENGQLTLIESADVKQETRMDIFNREIKYAESFDEVKTAAIKAGYSMKFAQRRWDMKVAAKNGEYMNYMRKMGWKGRKGKRKRA